ncbi:phage portal protein [Pseudonocardia benzenivorans]|uniref:Phage portal protein n=1 Tax=Pseudonocardia benzenivorans TaxID=228005 RepID=A0ABW3VTW0_9PSEU
MSLFSGLTTRALSYQDVWGAGSSPQGMSEGRALRLGAVYAAVQLIANGVAALPLHEYREDSAGAREPVARQPLFVTDPTEFGTPFDWKFQAVSSLALRGNAYGLPTGFDGLGRITRCEWLHPDDVSLNGDDDVKWWRGRAPEWLVDGRPTALIHLRNFLLPGRVKGLSPIGAFRTLIDTGLEAQQYGRDWFRNGSVPAGVLETDQPIRQGDAKILKQRFAEAAAGHGVVTLGRGTKYRPISVAPEEAQFLQTIQATATTIAAIFNVSPEDIGGETGGTLTYNTDETRAARLARTTLRPYMARVEEGISAVRPPGRVVRFNADASLRAETLARYQAHSLGLRDGWLSRDEVRAIEDMPPLPNGEGSKYQVQPGPTPPVKEGTTS